jgi:ADP-Ribosyltransferase in polyvalent proteins
MKYLDVLCETAANNPEFAKWFAGSKVVDKNGKPLVCFHGTTAKKLITPGEKSHFGTYTAANARLASKQNSIYQSIYPVYLRIINPIELPDYGFEDFENYVVSYMKKNNIIDDVTAKKISRGEIGAFEICKKKGFDGVVYKNATEDAGSISWIPFNHNQVWSMYNDKPTTMEKPRLTHSVISGNNTLNKDDIVTDFEDGLFLIVGRYERIKVLREIDPLSLAEKISWTVKNNTVTGKDLETMCWKAFDSSAYDTYGLFAYITSDGKTIHQSGT